MGKNTFLYSTFILIIANFIVRMLGFVYKIILSRVLGPEGIGLFHLVYPVLMIFITFTSAGIPVAVSKLVAYNLSLNNKRGCNKVLALSLLIGITLSSLLSIILLYYAKYIAYEIIKNSDVYYSLVALVPTISLITLSSIFRGYFYGIKKVAPPGISQVIEQIVRVVFVVAGLKFLLPIEAKYAAIVAVVGISVGELSGLLFLLLRFNLREALKLRRTYNTIKEGSKIIVGKIFYISIPITITRLIAVIMQSINAVLVPQLLQVAGYTAQESLAIFGKLIGMALPILFLPFIVTSALVVNIIPSVSEEMALKNWRDIELKSGIAIRMTILVAVPAMILFLFFADPLCEFMYNQKDVGQYLSLMAYSMVFLSLHHTASGILHGIGKQIITTINYLIGMTIQLLCTYFLVPNPLFGVNGYIIGFIISTILICFLNLVSLNYYVKLKIHWVNAVIKPVIASLIMTLLIIISYNFLLDLNIALALNLLISLFVGTLVYVGIVILSGSISIKTLSYIFKK